MYISNGSINCHFIIKKGTGGNNQSTCSFRTSVILNSLFNVEVSFSFFFFLVILKSYTS